MCVGEGGGITYMYYVHVNECTQYRSETDKVGGAGGRG